MTLRGVESSTTMFSTDLTERQKDILHKAVFEYIDRAEPVSSGWLEQRYVMPFSPATIRAELQQLAQEGYLEQPHTSAGRVPTDKGYRFFVDELNPREMRFGDIAISGFSALVLAYHQRVLWKEGWEQVLQEPEFSRAELVSNFTKFLLDIESNVARMRTVKRLEIYIGKENPFSNIGDFSIIVSECNFQKGEHGFVAIVGPKRMPYHRNIGLIHSFVNLWKKRLKK